MLFNVAVLIVLLLSFGLQEFLPAIPIAYHARLFLPVVVFLTGAAATSFSMMLVLAFVTGFLWDARHLPAPSETPSEMLALMEGAGAHSMGAGSGEMEFGLSILLFGILGALMQGVFHGSYPQACTVMSMIYVVGMLVIWIAPETKGQPLPE